MLISGTGNDTFVFGVNDDTTNTVKEFGGGDKLDLTAFKDAGYTITATASENGNTILSIAGADEHSQTIVLEGYTEHAKITEQLNNGDNGGFINA